MLQVTKYENVVVHISQLFDILDLCTRFSNSLKQKLCPWTDIYRTTDPFILCDATNSYRCTEKLRII